MRSCFLSLIPFSILILIQRAQAQIQVPDEPQCYFPDGSLRNSTDYQPCNNAAGTHSMCCKIANRADLNDPDVCLSNGLCSGVTTSGDGRALWRESCTDPTWKSPACVRICMTKGKYHDWLSDDAPLTLCDDGTVCCGGIVTGGKCCEAGEGVQLQAGNRQSTETVTSVVSSVTTQSVSADQTRGISSSTKITTRPNESSRSSSTTSSASRIDEDAGTFTSSSSAPDSTSSSGPIQTAPSNNAKIAIAVAVPVFLIVAFSIAFIIWRRHQKRKPPHVYEKNGNGPAEIATSHTHFLIGGYFAPKRSSTRKWFQSPPPQELETNRPRSLNHLHVNVHEMQ